VRFLEVGGLKSSVIGLGAWQFGSRAWQWDAPSSSATVRAIVRRAAELGVTLIDTAALYGFGASEQLIGEAFVAEGSRERFSVATKFWPIVASGRSVSSAALGSALRLQTDTIDLYQVHWHNPLTNGRRFARAYSRVHDEGLVRHIGVSNFSLDQWRTFERQVAKPVVSNQVRFNLLDRSAERDLLDYAAANDRLIIAYSPLAQGVLTGRFSSQAPSDFRRFNVLFSPENLKRSRPLLEALAEVGERHHATRAQIALAWVVSHPNVVAIVGSRSPAQLEESAAAADIQLDNADLALLEDAARRFRRDVARSAWQLGRTAFRSNARRAQ